MIKRIVWGIVVWVGIVGAFAAWGLSPQTKPPVEPQTGDSEFDTVLVELNLEASADLSVFLTHLSESYNVPEEEIEPLIITEEIAPADVYMIVALANLVETPVDKVVEAYRASAGRGWGDIAKRLGIKPGSKEFHQLKQGLLTDVEAFERSAKPGKKPERSGPGKKDDKGRKK